MSGAALMIQAYSAHFCSSKSDSRVMSAGANMVGCQEFADELRDRIERRYCEGGYGLGWRLLYSPAVVLEGARVAFIGINPGGGKKPDDHAEFAMASGSAFVEERWKSRQLQNQAQALFKMLGEKPEDVLAGNLVPFYTPSGWTKLPNDEKKKAAVAFGQKLWCDMIRRARPSLVVVHGKATFKALREELGGTEPKECVLGRGRSGRRTLGRRCTWPGGILVGLPHLSYPNSSSPGAVRCLLGLVGEKEGLHPAPSQQRSQKSHGTLR